MKRSIKVKITGGYAFAEITPFDPELDDFDESDTAEMCKYWLDQAGLGDLPQGESVIANITIEVLGPYEEEKEQEHADSDGA